MAVADAGSFSRAASAIRVAQPALSRQVFELEQIVGVDLLVRIARGVRPTEAGKAFYREAASILRRVEGLPEIARSAGGDVGGVVVLGLSSTLASFLTGPFLEACRTAYPRVKLSLITGDSVMLKSRINAGYLDLAVVYEDQPGTGFTRERLYRQQLYLVRQGALDDDAGPVSIASLAGLPLVLPAPPNVTRILLDRAFVAAGTVPNVVAEADVMTGLLAAVQRGLGNTILPKGDLSDVPGSGNLRLWPIEPPLHLTAAILSSEEASLGTAATVVRDLLVDFLFEMMTASPPPGAQWVGHRPAHAGPA